MLSSSPCRPFKCGLPSGLSVLLAGMVGVALHAAEEPDAEPRKPAAASPAGIEARQQAIEQLEELGREVRNSSSALLELVGASDVPLDLRRRAVLALANSGFEDRQQAGVLFDLLANPDTDVELRRTILMAHGEKDQFPALLVQALLKVTAEKENEPLLRRQALFALRRFGGEEIVLRTLAPILAEPADDTSLRLAILDQLRMFGANAVDLVDVLADLARDEQEAIALRHKSIETLRSMGSEGLPAAPALVGLLGDDTTDLGLRLEAAQALRQTGWSNADSVVLVRVLFKTDTPPEMRSAVADLLGRVDRLPSVPAFQWLPVLEDPDAAVEARRLAASFLARESLSLPRGLDLSARLLADRDEDVTIRLAAGEFLRRLGVQAAPAREVLEGLLQRAEAPAEIREVASTALAQIAQAWLERSEGLDRKTLNTRLAALLNLAGLMERSGLDTPQQAQDRDTVRRVYDVLRVEKESRWSSGIGDWAEAHPGLTRWLVGLGLLATLYALLACLWSIMARTAPLRLGKIRERWRLHEFALPGGLGGWRFGLSHISLLGCWARGPRVMEAWAAYLQPGAKARVDQRPDRLTPEVYLDVPVVWERERHETVPFSAILSRLRQSGGCVVITGGAATGKTALAHEIASRALHARRRDGLEGGTLLPVYIDLATADTHLSLLETILSGLNSVPSSDVAPSLELIRALVGSGKIILLLDGISEWPVQERDRITDALESLGRPTLLVTARHAGFFAERRPTRLDMGLLAGPAMNRFVQAFVDRSGAESQPAETEVLDACQYWSDLTAERGMPVESVRLFAEYLVMDRLAPTGLGRPENLVELVRQYVRHLNRRVSLDRLPEETVLKLTGSLAWACVQGGGALLSDARPESPEAVAQDFLPYLQHRLRLVWKCPKSGAIRFTQKTVCDYLAAGYLIDTRDNDEAAWKRLGDPSQGPLAQLNHALSDGCFLLSDPLAPIPLPARIREALDPAQHIQADLPHRLSPRVRQIVRQILAAENPGRSEAVKALGHSGAEAVPALPILLGALRNPKADLEIRYGVLMALFLLAAAARPAAPALRLMVQDRNEHLFLRIRAVEALLHAAPDDETIDVLRDRANASSESGLLRAKATETLAALKLRIAKRGPQVSLPTTGG